MFGSGSVFDEVAMHKINVSALKGKNVRSTETKENGDYIRTKKLEPYDKGSANWCPSGECSLQAQLCNSL